MKKQRRLLRLTTLNDQKNESSSLCLRFIKAQNPASVLLSARSLLKNVARIPAIILRLTESVASEG